MDDLSSLREALRHSPDNIPLRRLIAERLMADDEFEQAEGEYLSGLRIAPDDESLQVGLAQCYLEQGKTSAALVVAERLAQERPAPDNQILYARVLLRAGKIDEARDYYFAAVDEAPVLEDDELTARLGNPLAEPDDQPDEMLREPVGGFMESVDELIEMQRPDIDFSNVGGLEAVKESIRMRIIHPLKNKELFEAYGKKIGGGVLLYGPPGCGKTMLARATAGEIRARFMSVGLHDVLNMYIGQSEAQLHEIFEQARRQAPCVLFFDEVDALAASRTDMKKSGGRHIINQFLSEMDGVDADNDGLLILAATNAPWHVDSAFRRPGRFDRIIFVPPPDDEARKAIWELNLADKPTEAPDYRKLAAKTKQFSGADIRAAVDLAVEDALTTAMKTGQPLPLTTKMLLRAAGTIRSSTTDWFASARNYAMYANESGLYDEILEYLGKKKN